MEVTWVGDRTNSAPVIVIFTWLEFGGPWTHWWEAWVHPHFTKQNWIVSISGQGWVRMAGKGDLNHGIGNSEVWKWALTGKDCPGLKPLPETYCGESWWGSRLPLSQALPCGQVTSPSSSLVFTASPHQRQCQGLLCMPVCFDHPVRSCAGWWYREPFGKPQPWAKLSPLLAFISTSIKNSFHIFKCFFLKRTK